MSEKSKQNVGEIPPPFHNIRAYFVQPGMQARRLEIWRKKLQQLGATVEDHLSKHTTHCFAASMEKLQEKIQPRILRKLKTMKTLSYEWLEDSLKSGCLLPTEQYLLKGDHGEKSSSSRSSSSLVDSHFGDLSFDSKGVMSPLSKRRRMDNDLHQEQLSSHSLNRSEAEEQKRSNEIPSAEASEESVGDYKVENYRHRHADDVDEQDSHSSTYIPPDLNKNITEPFTELKDIYKDALGDDRRSFSYYKALSVLEKSPYKITSVDQVKGLPTIGKSLQDQINEIITTGKLSRLENFKKDERVRTISLFGSIWGIGPVTAQKLYEAGHRTLDDLRDEPSLTPSQRVGLKYHHDISKKIPRHEVQEMEALVQNAAEEIQPGMNVLCGGSYRRGKAFCGDMDFVITHLDGHSHKGFLRKFIALLKERNFLREDLLVGPPNSIEGLDSGVDTYYGLCTYPGREQRHRIDFKVYPLEIYPFGLIAWTGNDVLNRRLRLVAESKGYKLDDTGLFPVLRDAAGHKVAKRSTTVPCKTEKEVFDFLGFPWLEPHERNL